MTSKNYHIEVEDTDSSSAFQVRQKLIKEGSSLGPPDMCYVLKEVFGKGFSKLFSKPRLKGFYHFVFGADTSSMGGVATYLMQFVEQPTKRCCFCIYDLFSKYDVVVELEVPGTMKCYLRTNSGQQIQAGNVHWEGAYVSSVLRFFYSCKVPGARILEPFTRPQNFADFFRVAHKYWDRLGLVIGNTKDTVRYGENLLFPAISKYLLKRKRFDLHKFLFEKLAKYDVTALIYLSDLALNMNKPEVAINILKGQIQQNPYVFSFHYKKAQGLYKKGKYRESKKICQYLVELNFEVFEYWDLLINCHMKLKNYETALLCINSCPVDELLEAESISNYIQEGWVSSPSKICASSNPYFLATPEEMDFKPFTDQKNVKKARSSEHRNYLNKLVGYSFKNSTRKLYKNLVLIEKSIEWESLLEIITKVFTKKTETSQETTQNMEIQSEGNMGESSGGLARNLARHRNAIYSFGQSDAPEVAEPSDANNVSHDEVLDGDRYLEATLTPRKYFFGSKSSNRLSRLMNPNFKIQSGLFKTLLNSLYMDLKALYVWQKEAVDWENELKKGGKNVMEEKSPLAGDVWVLRGALAERMQRMRLAERAYRYAVDKGFSYYAWFRLSKLYLNSGNPKAVLVCLIEVIKQVDEEMAVWDLNGLPPWMQEILSQLCSTCGFKHIHSLAIELNAHRFPFLLKEIENLDTWKSDGAK
mgnify:FL=1